MSQRKSGPRSPRPLTLARAGKGGDITSTTPVGGGRDPDVAPRLILVLGAHRSGTSMVTAGLGQLGLALGETDARRSTENLKGFFEIPGVVALNDELLRLCGSRWENPLFDYREAAPDEAALAPLLARGRALLAQHFAGAQQVALKDPRICQLLPFWRHLLAEAGYAGDSIACVHVLRDPVEVAVSQRQRQRQAPDFYSLGEDLGETVALWCSMHRQAFRDAIGERQLVVCHEQVMADPGGQLARLAAFAGRTLADTDREAFAARFIDPALYRSRAAAEDVAAVRAALPAALALHAAAARLAEQPWLPVARLQALADGPEAQACEASLRRLGSRLLGRLQDERPGTRQTLNELKRALVETQAGREDLERRLQAGQGERERLRLQLDGQAGHLTQLERELADSDRVRREQDQALVDADADRQQLLRQLHERAAERDRLQEALQAAAARNAVLQARADEAGRMEASLSWRITRPLRRLRSQQLRVAAALRGHWYTAYGVGQRRYTRLRQVAPPWLLAALRPLIGLARRLDRRIAPPGQRRQQQLLAAAPADAAGFRPRVTVIVPNYNHAAFLERRLDSIYTQTYDNYEVLLLDDCSTDDSQAILARYQQRFPGRTRLLINERNSGGVFHQWQKGLGLATGELIWIAESDDWCSPNFLEAQVGRFADESVMLSYCRSDFIDDQDAIVWCIEHYLAELDPLRWQHGFVRSAHQLVGEAWAIKNILPNVSSALFRRPLPDWRERLPADWSGMRICGDWIFYLSLVRGGRVAYTPAATNGYRIHGGNASVATYTRDSYYQEHEQVARFLAQTYALPAGALEAQREVIVRHWQQHREDYSEARLAECYSLTRIRAGLPVRRPNLLMVGYGFAAGGGETFPIQLANQLRAADFAVSYLDCDQEPREPGVRAMLRADIPVYRGLGQLPDLVEELGLALIHSHHAWCDNSILDLLPADSDCRTVISLHGMYETIDDRELDRLLPRLVARTAHFVYTAGKNLQSFVERDLYTPERFSRIDNALASAPRRGLTRAQLGIPEAAFVLCLVSRAIPEKGWAEAVAAVRLARQRSGRDLRLILIGEGVEYDRLRRTVLPDWLMLTGFRDNIRDYYALADLGLLPSRFRGESYPLTVIDCLQAGRPVLASAVGEVPRMLSTPDGRTAGVLFELQDWAIPVDELAERIAALAGDPVGYAELLARVPAAAARFDPQRMLARYCEVYDLALQTPVAGAA